MFTSRTGAFMVQRLSTWQSRRGARRGGCWLCYEARKRPTTTPKPHALLKGCSLVPLVAEACAGGWAPAATSWKLLARAVAGRTGESVSVLTERLQQT